MPLPFLATKTRIPIRASNLVPRSYLPAALDTCMNSNMQLILAVLPDKITLLAQWLGYLPGDMNAGWLSLDKHDNSLARFLSYLFAYIPSINMDLVAQVESNPTINAEQA
jgi:ATP/maltotriose-dependent transcriptional regulator MalT